MLGGKRKTPVRHLESGWDWGRFEFAGLARVCRAVASSCGLCQVLWTGKLVDLVFMPLVRLVFLG